jgi:lipoate-protein ligase A
MFNLQRDGQLGGPDNMHRDEELLEASELGCLGARVYGWDGVWVTLGRFQDPFRDLISPAEVRWVVRPTGGKAVLHGHDVTVGLAVPLEMLSSVDSRSIKSVYRMVIRPIVDALRACGVTAALAEDTRYSNRGKHTADCFAFSSGNDVVDERTGKKLCGCALRLTDKAVLVQASIPNGPPLVDPGAVIVNADSMQNLQWDDSNFADAFEESLANVFDQTKAAQPR